MPLNRMITENPSINLIFLRFFFSVFGLIIFIDSNKTQYGFDDLKLFRINVCK